MLLLSLNFKTPPLILGLNVRLSILICLLCYGHDADGQVQQQQPTNSILKFDSWVDTDSSTSYFVVETDGKVDFIAGHAIVRKITATVWIVEKGNSYSKPEGVVKMAPANVRWKYAPALLETKQLITNPPARFSIVGTGQKVLETVLEKYKTLFQHIQLIPTSNAAIVTCSYRTLTELIIKEEAIIFADIYQKATSEIELIGYDRSLHGIQEIDVNIPNANGANIVIGIKESNMDAQDIDLFKRVNPSSLAHRETDVHATVVASLAGGAGNSFITGKGLAWKSRFFPSSYDLLFPDNGSILQQNNVSVQNHSYGTIVQSFYGGEAAAYDAQQYSYPNLIHVFSSGNRGTTAPSSGTYTGINGYANLTGNFKMSKNSITVGATDTSGRMTPFSSAGPMYDGRLAPHITALGPNGTSDAAAIVSGGIAVLQQVYKDSNQQQLPDASLIKALLFNSADDIDVPGIDYKSGYGAVNILKAVKALQQRQFIKGNVSHAETLTIPIQVPSNAANIKFTLVWNDPAAAINNNAALVNNIDLELTETSTGQIFNPWVLSTAPFADSLKLPAKRGRDLLNNAEQITIERNTGNQYILTVKGSRIIPNTAQPFYIAYQWDSLGSFRFTSPLNASDVLISESNFIKIKWEAHVDNPQQTGDLWVSYNNGNSWVPIANNVLIRNSVYNWPTPDTASSAIFKMEYNNRSYLSNNIVIAPLIKLRVDFYCGDSLQLSWNEHVYAQNYQVFQLTDSAYLKLIATSTQPFIRLANNGNVGNLYAVRPILLNGLYATRSTAIKPSQQGVACFYTTLLANDQSSRILLELNLSIPALTDSIVFEKIFTTSNVSKRLSAAVVTGNNSNYTSIDQQPLPGLNNYRARIYPKNGSMVTTNTVSVLSNANEKTWIYPNPARRGGAIQFKLRDITVGNELQILNASGQLLQTITVGAAGNIPTAGLPAGIYWYRILLADKSLYSKGKIFITN